MDFKEFARLFNLEEDLSSIEIVKHFLLKEYGYALPQIEDKTKAQIIHINTSEIEFSQDRLEQVLQENLDKYENNPIPIIVLRRSNIWLIDGYHRLAKALLKKQSQILAIVIS